MVDYLKVIGEYPSSNKHRASVQIRCNYVLEAIGKNKEENNSIEGDTIASSTSDVKKKKYSTKPLFKKVSHLFRSQLFRTEERFSAPKRPCRRSN